jgi:hypothetical protein
MARLPAVGGDDGNWGTLLNDFLLVAHNSDGSVKNGAVTRDALSSAVQTIIDNALTQTSGDARYLQLGNNLSDLANAATARTNLGLGNVNNTSDANKPISTAVQTALNAKADATSVSAKVLLIDTTADLPAGTPAGVVVVVKA